VESSVADDRFEAAIRREFSAPVRSDSIRTVGIETYLLGRHLFAEWRHQEDRCLERSGYVLLSLIEIVGPITLTQIKDALPLDTSTLSRQTARLIRDGFLERRRVGRDHTGLLALTQAGEIALKRDREHNQERLDRVLSGWDSHEIATFGRLIQKFNQSIEINGTSRWPREPD
jgi:DNA-binding MarR family transcriptional regulator